MARRAGSLCLVTLLITAAVACRGSEPPRLAPGSKAPDFTLPGIDGRTHALSEFAASKVLAVVFTGTSCPASQLYESRIQKLYDDYRARGVTVVAINPNKPASMQPADLGYSDVGETLDDMKARAAHRGLTYPFLSDAASQSVAKQFLVTTTPHVFVFDEARSLRYDGRLDDDVQGAAVKASEARQAIEALAGGGTVPVSRTPVTGCPVNGLAGPAPVAAAAVKEPVTVDMASADDLKRLRQNGTNKLLLVNFWATWCVPCAREFPDLETTYRMYKGRGLEFTAVSVNDPAERPAVLEFLQEYRAAHRNLLFSTSDVYGLQAAFDPAMPAPVPFTLLLAPNGDVLHQELGELDVLKLRRAILRNLPDDPKFPGLQAYWSKP